jgi:hypothetical protein
MAALDRISCSAIPLLQVVLGQVGLAVNASWHAPFYNYTLRRRINRCNQ